SACGHILDPNENTAAGSDMTTAPADGMNNKAMPSDTATPKAANKAASKTSKTDGDMGGNMGGSMTRAPAHPSGTLIGQASEIPVGGGMVFTDHKVVVTQPAMGSYKAFSSVCTHAGCQCNQVTNGQITCPCHGAAFSIKDGSVVA